MTGVDTARGSIRAKVVVHAAGAWATELPAALGIALPIAPLRRQVAVTEPWDGIPPDAPLTVFLEDGFHFRARDGRVLLLWPCDTGEPLSFGTAFEPTWLDGLLTRAMRRIPTLAQTEIDRDQCWAGLYEMSPDGHALLGPVPAMQGLFVIGGASGHGVMHAPALGLLLAEQIVHGEARSLDVRTLRPTRFLERDPIPAVPLL